MRAHRRFNNRGVCLAEVMVAMAAGAILLSATFQALRLFDTQLTTQHTIMSRHQDQRLGLHVLSDELRLAGSGAANDLPAVLVAGPEEIEFVANLDGTRTVLTDSVSAIQSELQVLNGSNWDQGKHILICTAERCAESRLAVDGRRTKLTLTGPVGQTFPAGHRSLHLKSSPLLSRDNCGSQARSHAASRWRSQYDYRRYYLLSIGLFRQTRVADARSEGRVTSAC